MPEEDVAPRQPGPSAGAATSYFVYVGSRTTRERNARGKGISVFRYDPDGAALTLLQEHGGLVNPSFLAIDRSQRHLYTVHGDSRYVSSFDIGEDGRIALAGTQDTGGENPVHLALDPGERFLVVSNHLSCTLAVLPVSPEGRIGPVAQTLRMDGPPGPHRVEQPHSKPHFNPFDPSGRYVLVPDKGLDRVFCLAFENGRLRPASHAVCRENSGPRNLVFHPRLPAAYVVNELDSTVTLYRYEPEEPRLEPLQIVPTLPQSYTGNSRASGIVVDPAGRFLYASNRGLDSIAVYAIDPDSGWLDFQGVHDALGKTPRFITLDPDGRRLFVAHEDSDGIAVFDMDPGSGGLSLAAPIVPVGSPVSVVFKQVRGPGLAAP
ncbi:lactonase family protein [Candidimonas humi]|nr:lactonase family protein [Candidimonas humi]